LKTFDEYKVEQAITVAETQRIMQETTTQLAQVMALLMRGGTVNMPVQSEPANRQGNRPRVSLEAAQLDQQTVPVVVTTEAQANTSDATTEDKKRAPKRSKGRHSPNTIIAPIPVSEAHLEDTTMESAEPNPEKPASPGLLPRLLTAATNSMSAVMEPATLINGIMEAAKRTNTKEMQSSLAKAGNRNNATVPVSANGDNTNDTSDTMFDTTPPPKETAESTDASLSEIDSESIEEVFTEDPDLSLTIHNISSIGNRDISTIAQDAKSDDGWSETLSETNNGDCGMRQRKGKKDTRLASDISIQHDH
jgi:hypothetical protein